MEGIVLSSCSRLSFTFHSEDKTEKHAHLSIRPEKHDISSSVFAFQHATPFDLKTTVAETTRSLIGQPASLRRLDSNAPPFTPRGMSGTVAGINDDDGPISLRPKPKSSLSTNAAPFHPRPSPNAILSTQNFRTSPDDRNVRLPSRLNSYATPFPQPNFVRDRADDGIPGDPDVPLPVHPLILPSRHSTGKSPIQILSPNAPIFVPCLRKSPILHSSPTSAPSELITMSPTVPESPDCYFPTHFSSSERKLDPHASVFSPQASVLLPARSPSHKYEKGIFSAHTFHHPSTLGNALESGSSPGSIWGDFHNLTTGRNAALFPVNELNAYAPVFIPLLSAMKSLTLEARDEFVDYCFESPTSGGLVQYPNSSRHPSISQKKLSINAQAFSPRSRSIPPAITANVLPDPDVEITTSDMSSHRISAKGLRLLSLDGDGLRGLAELLVLKEIMERLRREKGLSRTPKPCEYFDIIGGSSIGGIIAIMLARLRFSVDEAIGYLQKFLSSFVDRGGGYVSASEGNHPFEDAIKVTSEALGGDVNAPMVQSHCECKCFVVAKLTAKSSSQPCILRNYLCIVGDDTSMTVREAVLAVCGAIIEDDVRNIWSTDFSSVKEDLVVILLREIQCLFSNKRGISCMLSIGAGLRDTANFCPSGYEQLGSRDQDAVEFDFHFDLDYMERDRQFWGNPNNLSILSSIAPEYLSKESTDHQVHTVTKRLCGDQSFISLQRLAKILGISPNGSAPSTFTEDDFESLLQLDSFQNMIIQSKRAAREAMEMLHKELVTLSDSFGQLVQSAQEHRKGRCQKWIRHLAKHFGIVPSALEVPDIIPDRRPINGGGFADIYKGRKKDEEINLCLKVLRIFDADTRYERAQVVKDYCHEALVWTTLSHPNVLPFLGVNSELFSPAFCLVSPWMSHGNVMAYLGRNPHSERVTMIKEIAAGLDYLHTRHPPVVHGDIKGANVLVADDGRCCIADFGLAMVSESRALGITSSHGPARGSARWMSPEILIPSSSNGRDTRPRDIYALGCTAFEIMTGRIPFFEMKQDSAVALAVSRGERPPFPSPGVYFPGPLWDLVQACWAQEAKDRPTALEVLGRLSREFEC